MLKLIRRVKRAVLARIRIAGTVLKYCICRLLPAPEKKKIWVVCERGTDARDNGYAFYRYLTQKHPEICVYYLITPESADAPKVAEHAVDYGSWMNCRVVAKAQRIISTHCYTALPGIPEKIWRMLKLEKRFCFLQHGITQARLPFLFGGRTNMRLFCCAAAPEYEFVRNNFGHPESVVQCTGLARYDNLLPFETKNQILVMPTWRRYLNSEVRLLESDYFAVWNNLLGDQRLLKYLEQTHTKLVFYPHYEMQPYLKHFRADSPNVVLADFGSYDVQQLLKESKLLITDYSSVSFDFAYMLKPQLYYQFDAEEYHRQHYQEGYFSFERDGFGAVEKEHDELVGRILRLAGDGFPMDEFYRSRTEHFFAHRDDQNCERIFQAIQRLDN